MTISRLFARIAERETELADQAAALRTEIDQLTAGLHGVERDLEHVRITRQTAAELADGLAPDAADQADPVLPEHPLYPQIIAVFHTRQQPLRARDLCEALDLGLLPKDIEGIRSKLKRLVARGILAEAQPGLFTHTRP